MRNVALTAGDTVVFSSRAIPGNEKAIDIVKDGLVEQTSVSSPIAKRWFTSPAIPPQ